MNHLSEKAINTSELSRGQILLLSSALEKHKVNDIRGAESAYRKLLKDKILLPEIYNNLASILLGRGEAKSAKILLVRSTELNSGYSDAFANLAAALGLLDRWDECNKACIEAIARDGNNPMPYIWKARATSAIKSPNEGIKELQQSIGHERPEAKDLLYKELIMHLLASGRSNQALSTSIKSLRAYPASEPILDATLEAILTTKKKISFEKLAINALRKGRITSLSHYHLAKIQLGIEKEAQAIETLLWTVKLHPNHSLAWKELGVILKNQKNFDKATACLRRSIKEDPSKSDAWQALFETLVETGKSTEAIKIAHEATKQFSANIGLLLGLANGLNDAGYSDESIKMIQRHYKRDPASRQRSELINCEGLAHLRKNAYSDAVRFFRKGLRINPSDSGLWNNMGMAHGLSGNSQGEILCYKNSIKHSPNDYGSHVNLAMAHLAKHNFMEGFTEYEWRLKSKNPLHCQISGRYVKHGDQPKELLVCTEQGLGDTLQFCRFLHDLKARLPYTSLTLACPEKLIGLLEPSLNFVEKIVGTEQSNFQQGNHSHIALMSIPNFLGITPLDSCAPNPYIRVNTEIASSIRDKVRQGGNPNSPIIALNWKGNPDTEKSNLRGRSMNLEDYRPLADALPSAIFLSIQKGYGSEELDQCSFRDRFIDCQPEVSNDWNFVSTACYMLAADFVVTTDSCSAHLSGSIGQTTFLMLSLPCEWRWRGNLGNSYWYNSVITCQQARPGDWREPVASAAEHISAIMAQRHIDKYQTEEQNHRDHCMS